MEAQAEPRKLRTKLRAKFRCVKREHPGGVKLSAVYSEDPEHENKKFWEATPAGELEMHITNEDAVGFFELGAEYYLDFTLAPSSTNGDEG